ncbi:signal recognition particle-docking protein FtsY [Eubacteriales bacterium OttesenSCG-928-M02]|nr:signal recognition particle-docking protein FtsY [Eubacteriales bacterium OttesenSCG-928-M02]
MLEKTKSSLLSRMARFFTGGLKDDFFDELEEALILCDVGAQTTMEVVDTLRDRVKEKGIKDAALAKEELVEVITQVLLPMGDRPDFTYPLLILVVGVNGAGKTTSIGKLAHQFTQEGKSVLICAGDTFRAAAIEQLETWADRAGVQMVKSSMGADPAATLYDSIQAARARNCDVILCDTAGRLQNRKNLMDELNKIYRVAEREFTGEIKTLLVLDANTGQNGISQAKEFGRAAQVDGIFLTKLDGTAKGGVALSVAAELQYPVWYLGVGETMADILPFDPRRFAREMIGE